MLRRAAGVVTPTSDPNINNLGFIYSSATTYYYPTIRFDWNTTSKIAHELLLQ